MPRQKKDASQFKSIGNLAFYDGWHPNYFYFNTLYQYANSTDTEIHGNWDSNAARTAAQKVIGDAIPKINFNGLNNDDAIDQLTIKFQYIIEFLTAAYNTEVANELAYFSQKVRELKSLFTPEEKQFVAPLKRLIEIFQKGSRDASSFTDADYEDFIICINVLMQGLDSTKAIVKHEADRLNELDDIMNNLLKSRGNQAAGIKKGERLSTAEQVAAAERAEARLKATWKAEYLKHGNLSGKDNIVERKVQGQHGKVQLDANGNPKMKSLKTYNVFGGAQFAKKVKDTADVVLARWAKDTLTRVVKDKNTVAALIQQIQPNYPTDGNFYALVPRLRSVLILAIQQYGIDNLSHTLTEKVTKATAKSVISKLLKEDQHIFDTVQSYDIIGLDEGYGLKGQKLDLFKNASNTAQMAKNKSTELYNKMARVLTKVRDRQVLTEDETLLMKVYNTTNNQDAIIDLVTMIQELENLQQEVDKLYKTYNQQIETGITTIEKTLSVSSTSSGELSVTVKIVNGEISVDMTKLKAALRNNPVFQLLSFGAFNPNSVRSAIATIKGRVSQQLKTELLTAANVAINNGGFGLSPDELLGQMRQGLEQLEISVTGPPLSELLTAIELRQRGGDLIVDWNGKIMGKNDVISITIRSNDIIESIKLDLDDIPRKMLEEHFMPVINKARKNFFTEYQSAINEAVGTMTRTNKMDKYSAITPLIQRDMTELAEEDSKIGKVYRDLRAEWKKLKVYLTKQGVEKEKIAKAQNYFLNTLRNSIMESTTVKTYNNYVNNIGFKGGSLGTNLSQQLTRVQNLFISAGIDMPKEEKEWLRFAILNCSPLSIMGESNKGLIEHYLGAVAAFALFDEGGAEAKIINNFMKDVQNGVNKKTNPGIFHLYRTDTMFVPGSLILKKTLDCLKSEVLPDILHIPAAIKTGTGIEITNGASEGFIPNRPIATTEAPDTNAWSSTGKAIEKTVKLKILFLAGFLDIINSINSRLGGITMTS